MLVAAFNFFFYNHVVTHLPIYALRRRYLTFVLGYDIDRSSAIHLGCFFTGAVIKIGANSVINRRCYLDGRGGLTIGKSVSVSPETYILTASHDPHDDRFRSVMSPVVIEDHVWLGARAVVLPGAKIGRGAILGAGAVAGKTIPPRAIYVGNPARQVGERRGELSYALSYFPWFDTDIG